MMMMVNIRHSGARIKFPVPRYYFRNCSKNNCNYCAGLKEVRDIFNHPFIAIIIIISISGGGK